jgi:hypothetical protein
MRRPEGVDPETWRAQRAAYWKRVNLAINAAMLVAVALLIARYLGWLPGFG